MRFRVEQHLPGGAGDVIDALLDPAYLARLAALPKLGGAALVGVDRPSPDVVVQRVRYRFAGHLSPAVTRVVDPAKLTWVEETTYDLRARRATFRILPDHYGGRLRCEGTCAFVPGDGETTRVVDGDLGVSFPIVGRTVERAIVSGLEEHLTEEAKVLTDHLLSTP